MRLGMLSRRGMWLVVALVLGLTGCASAPRQAFNAEAHKDIKRIGMIDPAFSGEYQIQNFGHPGLGFGLVGALAAAAHMQSQTTEYTVVVKASATKFDVADQMRAALRAQLEASGYEVVLLMSPPKRTEWLPAYKGLDPSVDAYLDPVINYTGFFTASVAADYLPAVRLSTRLVKRDSGEILYSDSVAYGYQMAGDKVAAIPADDKYRFGNFEDLKKRSDLARQSLVEGVDRVAARVANDLKGGAPTKVSQQ